MAFQPSTLNGPAAADRMLALGTYRPGYCLEAVDRSFRKPESNAPGTYAWAIHAYYDARDAGRIYMTKNPPKGAVVYLSAGANGRGHICISMGDGNVVSTDTPRNGLIGVVSIQNLARRWGRRYLGWSDRLMGHNVGGLNLGSSTPTEDPRKEAPTMAALPVTFSNIADPKTLNRTNKIVVQGMRANVHVTDPAHISLIKRVAAGDPNMLQGEIDFVYREYLSKIN